MGAADRQELPRQLQARLRALARAEEQVGRQDVHPGQGGRVRRRDLHAHGQRWPHVLLRPHGMMPGILDMLEGVSKEKGIVWEDKLKSWKSAGQWHVEVYEARGLIALELGASNHRSPVKL